MNVLHINSYNIKGGAETVFNITRKNEKVGNYSGFVRTVGNEEPDINFLSWEVDNPLIGAINYIYSIQNKINLDKFLSANDIHIIHLHGFFSSISPSILSTIKHHKKRKNIRVVQTLHDFHLLCPNGGLYNFNKNIICEKCINKKVKYSIFLNNCDRRGLIHSTIKGFRSLISNNILHHEKIVDKFICPSKFIQNKLIESGVDPNKLELIRNPVITTETKPQGTKDNIICYFGRLSKEKNLDFLINTFSYWKQITPNNFKLFIIGSGEERENLLNIRNKSHCKEEIFFFNYMPFNELLKKLINVKYFALSSKCYEVAPMSVIEALSINILPIVPNIGGMKESIELINNIGAVYEAGNKDSWISAINNLETNYNHKMSELSENKNEILNKLSVQNYLNKISNLYYTLMA